MSITDSLYQQAVGCAPVPDGLEAALELTSVPGLRPGPRA